MTKPPNDPEPHAFPFKLHRGRRLRRTVTMAIITAIVLLLAGGGTALAVAELSDQLGYSEGY